MLLSMTNETVRRVALLLTEQEDQISLRKVLLKGVVATQVLSKVALFEIKSTLEEQRKGIAYYRDALRPGAQFENVERRQTLLRAVKQQEIVKSVLEFKEAHTFRYAIPILTSGLVTEVLSIEAAELHPETVESIRFLADIYRNHSLLLHKYERDTLTGLLNRRSFEDRINHLMKRLIERQQRAQTESEEGVSVPHLAVLDIDFFKRVNDTYGHLYGDDVLLLFSNQMREQFSSESSLFRFGGEEFVVVMDVDGAQAEAQLERFRAAIERFAFPQVGRITVSIGYSAVYSDCAPSEMVDRADQALYYAKESGRNRVCCYERLVERGALEQSLEQDGGEVELF